MDPEDYIPEALEMVMAWEIEADQFADAVNDQARLMAGITSDGCWEDHFTHA